MRAATQPRSNAAASPGVRFRPQSAGETLSSPMNRSRSPSALPHSAAGSRPAKDKANPSSDELIRDLEHKVRKVVEQKRAESDKLRFAVAKKRDDVERAKRILQDLLKDSEALGLHYDLSENGVDRMPTDIDGRQQPEEPEDPARLQPVASISRRPVYSKHTNIHELEAKLERRAKEALLVHRRTLVLEHIKKRLLNERVEVAHTTNHLKQAFADLNHETHELQKRDIAAAEAVSQVQSRLGQQKADMAESVRKFRRELALRQKWAKEKKKFEKYYNDQLQAVAAKASTVVPVGSAATHQPHAHTTHPAATTSGVATPSKRRGSLSPVSILKHRRSHTTLSSSERIKEDEIEQVHREAFTRIGVETQDEGIDPEEIIRICMSREELRKELDAKHDESLERIATLREQINKARSLAREDVPLSKRGTSQKIETKQLEISSVERQLATVVDQYMYVENAVRPLKIGLQQLLQNVSSATVNIDNMEALETCLVQSCEEMMRLLRATSPPPLTEINNQDDLKQSISGSGGVHSIPEEHESNNDAESSQQPQSPDKVSPQTQVENVSNSSAGATDIVSLDNFTSPYNVRIKAKKRDQYYVPGLHRVSATRKPDEEEELDEDAFEVMDRAMVKRVSSVVMCTTAIKKGKEKAADAAFGV